MVCTRLVPGTTRDFYVLSLTSDRPRLGCNADSTIIIMQIICLYSQGELTSDRRPVLKIIAESLSQHDENMLYRPHLVGKG
jgi:hypothetical protein